LFPCSVGIMAVCRYSVCYLVCDAVGLLCCVKVVLETVKLSGFLPQLCSSCGKLLLGLCMEF